MNYGTTTLASALRERGLRSRLPADPRVQGMILMQGNRDVGLMMASVGWCLIRLLDKVSTDDCRRCDVRTARTLLAGMDH